MDARDVAAAYFDAIARRDVEAMAGLWAADGEEHIAGQVDAVGPGGVREYFTDFFAAYPDFAVEVQSIVAEGERAAVHWTASGTQLGTLWTLAPTGARVHFEGIDLLVVRDGAVVRNDAVADTLSIARQLGLVPDGGSAAEQRLFAAFNTKTRLERRARGQTGPPPGGHGGLGLRGG